ncbi:MAG: hypothetical protein Q7T60_17095 [Sphingopyxis sp.]|nr:hypothetical protein [Sphingopyxis sp.]
MSGLIFLDSFSSLDDLKGQLRRDPKAILAVLVKVGRFSCFEIDQRMAKAMTWLLNQSGWVTTRHRERVRDADGFGWHERDLYPWTYCDVTPLGRLALAGITADGTPAPGTGEARDA